MQDRTTVRLPRDLLLRAKRKAAAQGRTLTALIEDGLRVVVSDAVRTPVQGGMPPISRATGGLMPGIDLGDREVLQEDEDLAYVASMVRSE